MIRYNLMTHSKLSLVKSSEKMAARVNDEQASCLRAIIFRMIFCTILLTLFAFNSLSYACDKIKGYEDRNCDGKIQIAFIGDSIVYGIGDKKNKGGYPLRVAKKLKDFTIVNLGYPGFATQQLLDKLDNAYSENATEKELLLASALNQSDYVIIDLGRNDRWRGTTPKDTFLRLKALRTFITEQVAAASNFSPFIMQAVLLLPNRSAQGPFVKELNSYIFKSSTTLAPANIRFDQVSKRLLQNDQIHPTPKGYDALAKKFLSYFSKLKTGYVLSTISQF